MHIGFLRSAGIVFDANGIPSLIKKFLDLVSLILKKGNHLFQRFCYILNVLRHTWEG